MIDGYEECSSSEGEESINADEGSLASYLDDLIVEDTSDEKERALENFANPWETSSNEIINEVMSEWNGWILTIDNFP